MTKKQFIQKIMSTSCENCPISTFCQIAITIACHQTARLYYNTHKRKGERCKWPLNETE